MVILIYHKIFNMEHQYIGPYQIEFRGRKSAEFGKTKDGRHTVRIPALFADDNIRLYRTIVSSHLGCQSELYK